MARSQQRRIQAIAQRAYWRAADGRVIVEAWRRSGLSLSAFAQRHGVTIRRLVYWRGQLARSAAAGADVQFHPVQVPPPLAAAAAAVVDGAIEIRLGAEYVVRVPRGVAAADLRAVLTALHDVAEA